MRENLTFVGHFQHSERTGNHVAKLASNLGFWLFSASKNKINKHFCRWDVTKMLSHASFKMILVVSFSRNSSNEGISYMVVGRKIEDWRDYRTNL